MNRETLEKLDEVLHILELINLHSKGSIKTISMNAINILDEIVPRPLPTYEENSN